MHEYGTISFHLDSFLSLYNAFGFVSVLFDCFNVYKAKTLTHDEIFRLYKVLLGHTISDDHILSLTFEALQHPKLRNKGEIQLDEFIEVTIIKGCRKEISLVMTRQLGVHFADIKNYCGIY